MKSLSLNFEKWNNLQIWCSNVYTKNNENEWMDGIIWQYVQKNYNITINLLLHVGPNVMGKHSIKTLKHNLIIILGTKVKNGDAYLLIILFGYRCDIQAKAKYSPYMVLMRRTPRFTWQKLNN
jgi:hypothetical protein